MQRRTSVLTVFAVLMSVLTAAAYGHASYTGYSGAPASRGSCASVCHGSTGGTIVVEGFPAQYVPGQSYVIGISHAGGSAIANFNCSVRKSNTDTTGNLTAGLNTVTYSVSPQEPRGIHFTSANRDTGVFTWTAPNPGVGDVTLYLAGMQGTSSGGPNTEIALTATQSQTGVNEGTVHQPAVWFVLRNRIVRSYLVVQLGFPERAQPQLRILNQLGARVAEIPVSPGSSLQSLVWEPVDARGARLAPGSYFAVLQVNGRRLIRKFTIPE